MKLDKGKAKDLESYISPRMQFAITLPVVDAEGRDTGIVVYVSVSPFGQLPKSVPKSVMPILKQLDEVVRRLELKP
jgi:hypothetical protein